LRRHRSNAPEPDACLQPDFAERRSGSGGLDPEADLERTESARTAVRDGIAGTVRAAYEPFAGRDRRWHVELRIPSLSREHDRSRHQRDPAEHHRPHGAWLAEELLGREEPDMNFGLSESQRILKDNARKFFAAECPTAEVRRLMETET